MKTNAANVRRGGRGAYDFTFTIIRVFGRSTVCSSMLESRTEVLSRKYGSELITCVIRYMNYTREIYKEMHPS